MGMSASQARLLALTSRIHDVEYQAQNIQAKKLQLANFSDAAYTEYLDALDGTTLTIKQSDNSLVAATFNNLCSSENIKNASGKHYSLMDDQGRLIVEQEVYDKYKNGGASDAYEFAASMMEIDIGDKIEDKIEVIPPTQEQLNDNFVRIITGSNNANFMRIISGSNNKNSGLSDKETEIAKKYKELLSTYCGNESSVDIWDDEAISAVCEGEDLEAALALASEIQALIMEVTPGEERVVGTQIVNEFATLEQSAYDQYASNASSGNYLVSAHDSIMEQLSQYGTVSSIFNDAEVEAAIAKMKETDPNGAANLETLLENFRYDFYRTQGSTVLAGALGIEKDDVDMPLFNYYANIYKQIEACGDCVSIETFNSEAQSGAANSNEWLNQQLVSGRFTLESYSVNSKGQLEMDTAMIGAETSISFSNTTELDKSELARAEAKYEKAMKDIDRKEKRYDQELAKLDTERQALTSQMDSLKTQISDNIDSTFGIFS